MKLEYKKHVVYVDIDKNTEFLVNEVLFSYSSIREILRKERVELLRRLTDAKKAETAALLALDENEKESKEKQKIKEEVIRKVLENSGWVFEK